MKYCLDTNIIIYAINGRYPQIEEHFRHIPSQDILIPAIVVSEIEYGASKSNDYERTIGIYRRFIEAFKVVPFDDKMAVNYGRIRADLEKRGEVIGPNDMLIAATSVACGSVLVTNNVAEFKRVEDLDIEDWTK